MDPILSQFVVLVIGLIGGFIGALVGGGGLITVPFLIFMGLPAHVAVGTNRLGAVGLCFSALYKYWKEKKVVWKLVLPLTIFSTIGALIGAVILLNLDGLVLEKIIGIVLIIILPFLFLNKDFGVKSINVSSVKKSIGYVLIFTTSIYGGLIGAGSGIFNILSIMYFFGLPIVKANATDLVPWSWLTIITTIIFAINGIVNYYFGIVLFIGMVLGGYLGARTAVLKGNKWVKSIFILMIVVSAIKLLFF